LVKKRKKRAPRGRDWEDSLMSVLLWPFGMLKEAWIQSTAAIKTHGWARWALVIFIFALFSRLLRPDWYSVRQFHPDERWLFGTTAVLHYPDLPGQASNDGAGLQYGALPLYALSVVTDVAGMFTKNLAVNDFVKPAGRALTGLVDAFSVLLIFMLGSLLFKRRVGLLAAALLAFTPLNIQLAHFFTVDPWMACFSIATLYAAAKVKETGTLSWSVASGVAYAAALASKSGALPLALPLLLAHFWPLLDPQVESARARKELLTDRAVACAVAAFSAIFAFLIFMPLVRPLDLNATLANWHKFFRNQTEQQKILVGGEPEGVPFVRQYWDTGLGFHLKNLCFYYQGLALGVTGLLAFAWYILKPLLALIPAQAPVPPQIKGRKFKAVPVESFRAKIHAQFPTILLVSWMLPYLLIVGVFSFAKFARYMLPLTPFLALLVAAAWDELGFQPKRHFVNFLMGLVLVVTAGYGLGYLGIYSRAHPWIETSRWMLEGNVPLMTKGEDGRLRRTIVTNETWGDDLPVDVEKGNAGSYDNRKIEIVIWDSPGKLMEFGRALSQSDILVMADARAYGTYLRLPTRFPLTYAYFETMMKHPDKLGYELAHASSNQPRWMGLFAINDSRILSKPQWAWADESFTLYDHPHAFVFRRVRPIKPEAVTAVLEARVKELGLPESWRQARSPEENRRQSQGVSVSTAPEPERVNPNIGLSRGALRPLLHPVLMWWLLAALLGLLALPLCMAVFKNFPDGGYALARALGLFLFSWVAYNLAWWKILPFYQGALWALLAAALLGLFLWSRSRRPELLGWWRKRKTEILWSEAIFAAAFLYFCLVRAYNPNIHDIAGQGYFGGGEPLGMTYLSAVTRCATFPVYDPWLALKDSSYYYFGYVMAGTLTKLSGFAPAITYNLSLALFFALSVLSAYGVSRALSSRRVFALVGAGAAVLFGSLWSVPTIMNQATPGGHFSLAAALRAWFSHSFIWDPTRFPDLASGYIFEFPSFSYLYSDLHPHNMVIPLGLVLTALLLVPFKSAFSGWKSFGESKGAVGLWIFLFALLLDAQYAINTWNYPVFVALGLGALLVGPWAGKPVNFSKAFISVLVGLGLFLVAVGVPGKVPGLGTLLMHGFREYFIQDSAGRLGVVQAGERQMPAYIPMAYFIFGLAALSLLGGLRLRSWLLANDKKLGVTKLSRKPVHEAALVLAERLWLRMPVRGALILGSLSAAVLLLIFGFPGMLQASVLVYSLGVALACFTLFSLRGWEDGGEAFLWMSGCFALCLVAGSELRYVADRTNTIFKFWFNGWILMGLVFGAAFARWFDAMDLLAPLKALKAAAMRRQLNRDRLRVGLVALGMVLMLFAMAAFDSNRGRQGGYLFSLSWLGLMALSAPLLLLFSAAWARLAGRGLFFALLCLGLLYPVGATVARISDSSGFKNPHLNGVDFMKERLQRGAGWDVLDYDQYDAQLIDWLNANAPLTEPLLEAPGIDMYKGLSRFAIYTGLPTVLGWDYQVGQQLGSRAGDQLTTRMLDSLRIYHTKDVESAKALLRKYRIRWIVVGGIEHKIFKNQRLAGSLEFKDEPDFAKFDGFCEVALRNKGAVLYKFTDAPAVSPVAAGK
jgi:YYY domain-containing protein